MPNICNSREEIHAKNVSNNNCTEQEGAWLAAVDQKPNC